MPVRLYFEGLSELTDCVCLPGMALTKGLILISRCRYFRMRNSRIRLHFSDEDCDNSASSTAFFEVRNVL